MALPKAKLDATEARLAAVTLPEGSGWARAARCNRRPATGTDADYRQTPPGRSLLACLAMRVISYGKEYQRPITRTSQ